MFLSKSLDYESQEFYSFKIQIMSLQGFINKKFAVAQIAINVIDVNDNKPYFIYPEGHSKYYGTIYNRSPISTTVTQIKADDKDTGKFGKIKYSLLGNKSEHYFTIDPTTGIIKTRKNLQDIDLPFKFAVTARDNPNATMDFYMTETNVIINLISSFNKIILVIVDANPEKMETKLNDIIQILQNRTGLIVGIEKLTPREYINENGTLETDTTGTDIWLYVVDPITDTILYRNSTLVKT